MFNNKKTLLFSLCLIVILVLGLAFYFFKSSGKITPKLDDNPAGKQSAATASSTSCRELSSVDGRDRCFNERALRYQEIENCNLIADDNLKKSCQNIIVLDKAGREKKFDNCLNISAKDECFAVVLGIRDGWAACVQDNDPAGCLEKLFTGEAVKRLDSEICRALVTPADCLAKVSAGK